MRTINNYLPIKILGIFFLLSTKIGFAQSFDDRTLDANIVTPVTLLSFTANQLNNDIVVSWKTATEINNSHFIIERSTNGIDFASRGKVLGNGNASVVNKYSFTDINPTKVNLYYRLKQVDIDANSVYSKIVLVKNNKPQQPTVQILTNPIQQKIVTVITNNFEPGIYVAKVFGIDGKSISIHTLNTSSSNAIIKIALPLQIPAGEYIVQITNQAGTINLVKKISIF